MKDTIERIKATCKKNKLELSLMGIFILAALILSGPELAEEAAVLYGTPETETEQMTETEPISETEVETETETEGISQEERERLHRKRLSQLGRNFRIPMVIPEEEEEETLQLWELKDANLLHGYEMLASETIGLPMTWVELMESLGEQTERPLSVLRTMIENQVAAYDGDWSVYVKNLSTDESFVVNDQPMKSASVMKLFIMGTVYKAFETGDLERTDEIMSLMNNMIINSDNEASNQLLYKLGDSDYAAGIAKVDAFIEAYGFSEMTVEYNGFNNSATNTSSEHYNQVSAKDCGKLLEDIYRRTWVSRSVSNEMEAMLLSQNTRYKIPAGLPDGVLCGNKTGEMSSTENDAAIIYAEDCDYILVVLSSDWGSKDTAISRIRDISSVVYEYLN